MAKIKGKIEITGKARNSYSFGLDFDERYDNEDILEPEREDYSLDEFEIDKIKAKSIKYYSNVDEEEDIINFPTGYITFLSFLPKDIREKILQMARIYSFKAIIEKNKDNEHIKRALSRSGTKIEDFPDSKITESEFKILKDVSRSPTKIAVYILKPNKKDVYENIARAMYDLNDSEIDKFLKEGDILRNAIEIYHYSNSKKLKSTAKTLISILRKNKIKTLSDEKVNKIKEIISDLKKEGSDTAKDYVKLIAKNPHAKYIAKLLMKYKIGELMEAQTDKSSIKDLAEEIKKLPNYNEIKDKKLTKKDYQFISRMSSILNS